MNISITLDEITFKTMESIRKEKRQNRSEYIKNALIKAEKKYNTKLEEQKWNE